ncbi:HD domain-containing protein [Zavarzinella formosa]|uniref:HD domain-containing protein n=1 Tax=Zavarzinella formosa TaxID=360055 RepID=UPI0002F8C3BF|nr:HD domain-containing protein [Zavarzinella formosa]
MLEATAGKSLTVFALGFAIAAHRGQTRKYTGEAYVVHCSNVGRIVAEHTNDQEMIAAALLHDVLEDTNLTGEELRGIFGDRVTDLVLEVTDVSHPRDGNREKRKALDREHLARSSPEGATIKLADTIDNTESIAIHDPNFARVYLGEMDKVLPLLRHGDARLWDRAERTLQMAQEKLIHHELAGSRAVSQ